MRLSGRLALLAYNCGAVLAGAGAVFAFVHLTMADPPKAARREIAQFAAPLPLPPAVRLGFVPHGAFVHPEPPSADVALKPSIDLESAPADAWSTDVRPEAWPTQVAQAPTAKGSALLPSLRLPWQSASPGTLRRAYTLKARLVEISPGASARLAEKFAAAKVAWPPSEIALIALKDEKTLELFARPSGDTWKLIHRYRVLAASGSAGPKLRKGDRQVPEGVYGIAFLNPSSAYHVSLAVNYPNAFDRQMAAKDGRKDLGGDIMIHGKNLSAGCLAMGDEAAEELFVLAAQTGVSNVRLIIAPTDFRHNGVPAFKQGDPPWTPKLYTEIASALSDFKAPRSTGFLSFFSH